MTSNCAVTAFDSPEPTASLLLTLDVSAATMGAHGELDCGSVALFLDSAACLLSHTEPDHAITLSLRGVTFIDSAGIEAVEIMAESTRAAGRHFVLLPPADRVARVFSLAGADHLLTGARSREEARLELISRRAARRPLGPAVRAELAMRRAERSAP